MIFEPMQEIGVVLSSNFGVRPAYSPGQDTSLRLFLCAVPRKDLPRLGVVALPSLLCPSRCVDLSMPHAVPCERCSDLLLRASHRSC